MTIRGRLGYHQIDGSWVVNTLAPLHDEEKRTVTETLNTPSPDAIIKNIRQLLDHETIANRSGNDAITVRELDRSLARIDLGHADLNGFHTLGTGWPTGSYHKFGVAFLPMQTNMVSRFITTHPKVVWKMATGSIPDVSILQFYKVMLPKCYTRAGLRKANYRHLNYVLSLVCGRKLYI